MVLGIPFTPITLIKVTNKMPYNEIALETCIKEYRPEYLKIFLYNPNIKNIGKEIIMEIVKASNPLSERGIRFPILK